MINAKDAAKLAKIGYEKKFKEDLRELESSIKRCARRGENYYWWDGSYIEEINNKILNILTSKGYKISKSSNTDRICIEW